MTWRSKASFSRWHSSASTSETTSIPAARSRATPAPSTTGFGSPAPTTTRATPASIRASVQGGGPAGVIARLERADDGRAAGTVTGLGERHRPRRAAVPGPSCQPSPTTARSRSTTAPTIGFGETRPQPRAASSRARRMCDPYSSTVLPFVPGVRRRNGKRHGSTGRARRGGAVTPVSSHPDFHGRSRNPTGSTRGWRPWGRGLSPPVGNCTPPRKQAVRAASIRSGPADRASRGSGRQAVRGRSRR